MRARVAVLIRTALDGYDRRSVHALAALFVVYAAVGLLWPRLIDVSRGMDWLLGGVWAAMTALLCWKVDPRRDATRAGVGFVGGLCIEAWGTVTLLWSYWTVERPPLWILPAWPVAALAIDRIARLLDPLVPRGGERLLYWILLPSFVVWMSVFVWPTADHLATRLVIAAMVATVLLPGDRREDLLLFAGGALLGIFLEYWGTTRHCWTYYTLETPPPEAVVAHGFASVAFARGAALVDRIYAGVSTWTTTTAAGSEPVSARSRSSAHLAAGSADQSTSTRSSASTTT